MKLLCPEVSAVGATVYLNWQQRHRGHSCPNGRTCRPCQADRAQLDAAMDACSSRGCLPGSCLADATANS